MLGLGNTAFRQSDPECSQEVKQYPGPLPKWESPAEGAVHLTLSLGSEAVPYGSALPFFMTATLRRLGLRVLGKRQRNGWRLSLGNCSRGILLSQCPQGLVNHWLDGTQTQRGRPRKDFVYP